MNSFIVTSSTSQLSSISIFTIVPSISEGSVPLDSVHKLSSSWRKFVHTSTQQPESKFIMTVMPTARTTTKGPVVLKPMQISEDYDARKEAFRRFLDSLESEARATDDVTAEQ